MPVIVSGNGTTEVSKQIAIDFNAKFLFHPQRLSPDEHHQKILEEAKNEYIWIIGDDDILAPQSLLTVAELLSKGAAPSAIIGRAASFSNPDRGDLGPPLPSDQDWAPGCFSGLEALGRATGAELHYGAFLFRKPIVRPENFVRFEGTSHGLFGAFWDGIAECEDEVSIVVPKVLVYLRQQEKEWEFSRISTLLGLARFQDLLPADLFIDRPQRRPKLTRSKALSLAVSRSVQDKSDLLALIETYESHDFLSKQFAVMPPKIAKSVTTLKRLIDSLYARGSMMFARSE